MLPVKTVGFLNLPFAYQRLLLANSLACPHFNVAGGVTVTPTPEPVDPTPEPTPEVTPEPETPSTGFSCTGDAGIPESDVCCEVRGSESSSSEMYWRSRPLSNGTSYCLCTADSSHK